MITPGQGEPGKNFEEDTLSEKKRKTKAPVKSASSASSAAAGPAGPMSVEFLQKLVDLMTNNDLNTVDLRDSGRRIILKRGAVQAPMSTGGGQQMMTHSVPAHAPQLPAPAAPKAPVDEDAGLVPIKSPMVGTFYVAATPEAKAFVSVGSTVVKDDTDVCIIEAMKVFNNIKSEVSGTIARILVTNGQTVEFGTPLFLVKPS